jgi:hypothetical protein
MSKYDWSTTAADNDDADSGINWTEGQPPSSVNGSARQMMAEEAKWLADTQKAITSTGSSNAYAVTTSHSLSAYPDGFQVYVLPNHDSTGAATIDVDGVGAKALRAVSGEALPSGAIKTNRPFTARYRTASDEFLIDVGVSTSFSGILSHESGGLEADVSAYEGMIAVLSGATEEVALRAPSGSLAPHMQLKVYNNATNPAYQVDITADEVLLYDSSNREHVASAVSETADITASGVNGLDAGSEANSTGYYIFVIYNGTDVNCLLSTSRTAPTMPSGYTYKALVGWVFNDSGGDFLSFVQNGKLVAHEAVVVLSGATNASLASFSVDLPENATCAQFYFNFQTNTTNNRTFNVQPQSSGTNGAFVGGGNSPSATARTYGGFWITLDSTTQAYYANGSVGTNLTLYHVGFLFE